jgi:hypothetical protein
MKLAVSSLSPSTVIDTFRVIVIVSGVTCSIDVSDHPANLNPAAGVAVSTTSVPFWYVFAFGSRDSVPLFSG